MNESQKIQLLLAENESLRERIRDLQEESHQEHVRRLEIPLESLYRIEQDRVVERNEMIEALAQRCVMLAAESASFESRWREVGEQYAAERARRHAQEAADAEVARSLDEAGM